MERNTAGVMEKAPTLVDIVIPVFNQRHYTQRCLESLRETTGECARVFVVDNGSTDGTGDYLATLNWLTVISNQRNLGCAAAWNQGVSAGDAPWVVILNNDVILPRGWLEGLLEFAGETDTDIISPALREGEYNYDLAAYAESYMAKMGQIKRNGEAHGVCFMVRRKVFGTIGGFDENFTIGGSEDTDFFWRARHAAFTLATTGRSFMHHFGCVTQDYIKAEILGRCYGPEHRAHFRKKWQLTWWKRFLIRNRGKIVNFCHRTFERASSGHSLREKWFGGTLHYY